MLQNTLEHTPYTTNFNAFFDELVELTKGVKTWQDRLGIAADLYSEKCHQNDMFLHDRFGDDYDRFHLDPTKQWDNDGVTAGRLVTTLEVPDSPEIREEVRQLCKLVDALVRVGEERVVIQTTVAIVVERIEKLARAA